MSVGTQFSTATQRLQFPFPGAQTYLVAERDGQRLGHVDYSVNALRDRVYINNIEVCICGRVWAWRYSGTFGRSIDCQSCHCTNTSFRMVLG
jgi:hypothetical protein